MLSLSQNKLAMKEAAKQGSPSATTTNLKPIWDSQHSPSCAGTLDVHNTTKTNLGSNVMLSFHLKTNW